ncbi:hypothetical protein L1D41_24640 [Vibrio harveyi]|uniref:hypothetical protein n=1 Tax=Vibrio harveyi TaxID=669 RepID=UPI0006827EAA|nr:hypothetical protein [Vibrio harveyi]MCG9612829.1 hypothetical protein [Vibrio harveyi]MCG9671306.1 hypothetical protein [Vibrio harveyi]
MESMFQLTEEEEKELAAFEEARLLEQQEEREKQNVVAFRMNGHDVMHKARLPLHFRARIREMRVGDTFIMGSIRHVYDEEDVGKPGYEGVAEIYVTKERKGQFHLRCNWSLLSKPSRPMMFAHVTFKYEKGGVFAFLGTHAREELRNVCLVSRFIHYLTKQMSKEERDGYDKLGLPLFLTGVNVDKNLRTTRTYAAPVSDVKDFRRVHYQFKPEQMPKPMMECILDVGIFTGDISF